MPMLNVFCSNKDVWLQEYVSVAPALYKRELPGFLKKRNSVLSHTTAFANILTDYCMNNEFFFFDDSSAETGKINTGGDLWSDFEHYGKDRKELVYNMRSILKSILR